MKLKNIGDKSRGENATEASQLSSCLSYFPLCSVFRFVLFFCQKRIDLLAHNLICYSYIKLLILPKAEHESHRTEQQISEKKISLFPTRVLCFWDTVQQLDMWMQLSIHLGNSSISFARICTQADFGNRVHILEGEKSWFKTPLQTVQRSGLLFSCSYSQVFNIFAINPNSSTFKRSSECPLLT